MKLKKLFPKSITLIIIPSILIIFIYIGWTYIHNDENKENIQSGCFNITFTNFERDIEISNLTPISDEHGILLEPYTFTIRNTCQTTSTYQLSLENMKETTIDLSKIKISIDNEEPIFLLTLNNQETDFIDSTLMINLKKGTLSTGFSHSYSLRIWLDENSKYDSSTTNLFKGKIIVNSIIE